MKGIGGGVRRQGTALGVLESFWMGAASLVPAGEQQHAAGPCRGLSALPAPALGSPGRQGPRGAAGVWVSPVPTSQGYWCVRLGFGGRWSGASTAAVKSGQILL